MSRLKRNATASFTASPLARLANSSGILTLPLYYTGLNDPIRIRDEDGGSRIYPFDREYRARLPVKVTARWVTWFVMEQE